jgi:hypothetical protein
VRRALRSSSAPKYQRPAAPSKLDPFKDEIHRLLRADARMPGQRIRELIGPLGYAGGKTIVDDYLREVRPLFAPPRTSQRTIYRPAEVCQFDLREPAGRDSGRSWPDAQGLGGGGLLGLLARGRWRLVFSKETPDLLFGIRRCLWRLGALPETLV